MPKKLTKQAAVKISADLDRIATHFQNNPAALGVPSKVANDFALRCDILSDHVEKRAGVERDANGELTDAQLSKLAQMDPAHNYTMEKLESNEFDPAEIGEEQSGALLRNEDEPYMDVFKQDEFDQLRQVQQDGMFSNAKAASSLIAKMANLLSKHEIKVPVNAKK